MCRFLEPSSIYGLRFAITASDPVSFSSTGTEFHAHNKAFVMYIRVVDRFVDEIIYSPLWTTIELRFSETP